MKNNQVSIIIPLYNKEEFIEETLKAVSLQSYSEWECFIIDDHSTDKGYQKVKNYIQGDLRFTLLKNIKRGASAARNLGLKMAQGKYIQFLDADDIISKRKLEVQVELIKKSDEISLVTCAWGRFKDNDFENYYQNMESYANFDTSHYFLDSLIASKGYFPIHSYLIRREIIDEAGFWNENLSLNDDGEFMMRVLVKTQKIKFAPKVIAWYRTGSGNNLSSFKDKEAVKKAIYSWMLIDINLKIRFGEKAKKFREWSKDVFFINIRNSHPELINYYSNFFSGQIKEYKAKKQFIYRLLKKLKVE